MKSIHIVIPCYNEAHRLLGQFDFVAYLDADFSTLPETLGQMLQAAEPRHRFILGSRVLRAGAVIERSRRRWAVCLGLSLPSVSI